MAKKSSRWFKRGGSAHRGWYKGYWCDSSWELAFLMWHLDHGVEIVRNTGDFPYEIYGKKRFYRPDFIVNGVYHEIKGVMDGRSKRKLEQFPYPIKKIGAREIKPFLSYARSKYGENFYELLESVVGK